MDQPGVGIAMPGFHFGDCGLIRLYGSVSISSSSSSPREHLPLPLLVLGLEGVELGHHLGGEQLERLADVLVAVAAGLVEQDHLVDVGLGELVQLGADRVRRADQPAVLRLADPRGTAFHVWYSSHRLTVPGTTGPCSL